MIAYQKLLYKNITQFVSDNGDTIMKALAAVWFFFAGIHTYMYAVMALAIFDVITGVAASLHRGEHFKSRILRKGLLEKFGLYAILILTVFVLDLLLKSVFHYEGFYFSFILTFLISTYECSSIMENLNSLNPDIPFLSGLVRIFKKMGEKTIDGLEAKVGDVVDQVVDTKQVKEEKKDG